MKETEGDKKEKGKEMGDMKEKGTELAGDKRKGEEMKGDKGEKMWGGGSGRDSRCCGPSQVQVVWKTRTTKKIMENPKKSKNVG